MSVAASSGNSGRWIRPPVVWRQPDTGCCPQSLTPPVWLVVWLAGSVGFLVGCSRSNSVVFLPGFLEQTFPETRVLMGEYLSTFRGSVCTLANQWRMRAFLAAQPLSAGVGALMASPLTRRLGRKMGLATGIVCFLFGELMLAASYREGAIWVGRLVGGFGDGLSTQAIYLEIVEVALSCNRGQLASFVSIGRSLGLLCAGLLTFGFGTARDGKGWRFVHVWALWPALVTLPCLACLPDTPASLIERGKVAEGRHALQQIRGPWYPDIEQEVGQLIAGADLRNRRGRYRVLTTKRNLPPFLMGVLLALTNAWSGGMSYVVTPVLLGSSMDIHRADLVASVFSALASLMGSVLAMLLIDRAGRRALLGIGYAGIGSLSIIGGGLLWAADRSDSPELSWGIAGVMVANHLFMCFGPLSVFYVYVTETHPLATRALGLGTAMAAMEAFAAIASFTTLPLLCRNALSLVLALGCIFLGVIVPFVVFLTIEPKKVPVEEVEDLWAAHWLWGTFYGNALRAPPLLARLCGCCCGGGRGRGGDPGEKGVAAAAAAAAGVSGSGGSKHPMTVVAVPGTAAAAAAGSPQQQPQDDATSPADAVAAAAALPPPPAAAAAAAAAAAGAMGSSPVIIPVAPSPFVGSSGVSFSPPSGGGGGAGGRSARAPSTAASASTEMQAAAMALAGYGSMAVDDPSAWTADGGDGSPKKRGRRGRGGSRR